jgi:UDP-glucose:(heptosyl)LPS alpha-1,3-glucosyltransferase
LALDEYREFYSLSESRYCLLPPGISREFINADGQRLSILHDELMLDAKQRIVLMVGSGFKTKGLDRAIDALASLPEPLKKITHLVVTGDDRPDQFIRQAKDHGLKKQVHFLGGRKDILKLFRSADVLIHPAYREAAGIVLLEAAVSALPVITTQVCGNAHYIADNLLGVVIPQPFQQSALNAALYAALTDTPQQQKQQQQWRNNCRVFAAQADIYSMTTVAADKIEWLAQRRQKK